MIQSKYCPSQLSRNKDQQCVCEICECGNHKCPKQHNRYPDNIVKTTFQKDYVKYNAKPEKSFKVSRTAKLHPYEKNQLRSQYTSEYVKFPIEKENPFKITGNTVQNDLPFSKRSEYTNNYAKFDNCKRNPFHQHEIKKMQMPFMGRSTYKNDFNKFKSVPKADKLNRNNYNQSQKWMQSATTYQNDFQKWRSPDARYKPQTPNVKSGPPLDTLSMYKSHYVGFDPRIYQHDVCPIDQLPPRPKQLHPGKEHLNLDGDKMVWN